MDPMPTPADQQPVPVTDNNKILAVNQETCIGCGTCIALCSDIFAFNDNGKSYVKEQKTCDSCSIQSVIDSCPVAAIGYIEKPQG